MIALCILAGLAVTVRVVPNSHELLQGLTGKQIGILEKLNRADAKHLPKLKKLAIPDLWGDEFDYATLPLRDDRFALDPKAIVVDVPTQQFGAYEFGDLVQWGPVSTGSRRSETPEGQYQLNWRSRARYSTVDSDWYMTWYWNIDDRLGIALHAYALPGGPASHGCIRMLERDAQWVYGWGAPGARVVVEGRYDHGRPKPWLDEGWWRMPLFLKE